MKLRTAILLTALGMLTLVVIAVVAVRVSGTGDDVGDFVFGEGAAKPTATRTPRPTATPVPGPSRTAVEIDQALDVQRGDICEPLGAVVSSRGSPSWDEVSRRWAIACSRAYREPSEGDFLVFQSCFYVDDRTLEITIGDVRETTGLPATESGC